MSTPSPRTTGEAHGAELREVLSSATVAVSGTTAEAVEYLTGFFGSLFKSAESKDLEQVQ